MGIAYPADQLGASARATDIVVVAAATVTVAELANVTAKLLAASFEAGDVEGVFQAMVASSSVLNAPNCTLSCGLLNRGACPVDGTCGDCLDGYVGLIGPSNDACWVAGGSAARRRLGGGTCDSGVTDGDETDVDCGGTCAPCVAAGAACLADSDCYYGWCSTANTANMSCAMPVKQCSNNCTNQGSCGHIDVTGAHLAARDCTVDDWACSAVCTCRDGWCARPLLRLIGEGGWYNSRRSIVSEVGGSFGL